MEFGFNETLADSIHTSFISSRRPIYLWSHPAPAPRCDRVTETTVLKYSGYVQFLDFPSAAVLSSREFNSHVTPRRDETRSYVASGGVNWTRMLDHVEPDKSYGVATYVSAIVDGLIELTSS